MSGVRNGYALLTFSFSIFVAASIAVEFFRGTLARRNATGDSAVKAMVGLIARNKRRYGGYLIHVGVVLVFAGIAGSAYNLQTEAVLRPGESATIGDYTLVYDSQRQFKERNKDVFATELTAFSGGREVGSLSPEKAFYPKHGQPVSEVAILSFFQEDLYAVLEGLDENGAATFQFFVNPLVGWIWAGGWMMLFGTVVAMLPAFRRQQRATLKAPAEALQGERKEIQNTDGRGGCGGLSPRGESFAGGAYG